MIGHLAYKNSGTRQRGFVEKCNARGNGGTAEHRADLCTDGSSVVFDQGSVVIMVANKGPSAGAAALSAFFVNRSRATTAWYE